MRTLKPLLYTRLFQRAEARRSHRAARVLAQRAAARRRGAGDGMGILLRA